MYREIHNACREPDEVVRLAVFWDPLMRTCGIVLAGGRSRRMGVAKATLPFGPEKLLERVVRIVREATGRVIVVAAVGQELLELGPDVLLARDAHPGRGPLEGLAAGLRVAADFDAAYVSGCDTPLLTAQFIRRVIESLDDDHQAAIPVVDGLPQPLAGVYRPAVLPQIEQMLAQGRFKLLDLLGDVPTCQIQLAQLRDVDPNLRSLRNLNTPADYESALAAAGLK